MEFASNGFIAFFIDHLDGSNGYTTTESKGKCEIFDTTQPFWVFKSKEAEKHFKKKMDVRVQEVVALIDEIEDKDFV